jgi:hypothetical protein
LSIAALKYPLFAEIINQYEYTSDVVFDWNNKRDEVERGIMV